MVEERRAEKVESQPCPAQEQAIRTNSVKYSIDKTSETAHCKLCNENVESVTHIISACPNLAKNQYRKKHDKVHWLLSTKFHQECNDKWYEHVPDSVLENEGCKILWDFPIQSDAVIKHRPSHIACIDKIVKSCLIIDIAVPGDQNIIVKEQEKIDKYQDLRIEFGKLWKFKAGVIPGESRNLVVGALGTISQSEILPKEN